MQLTRAANLVVSALLLLVPGIVLLVLPGGYQPYLLAGLVLLLVLPFVVSKVWERPALGIAGVLLLIVVPWGGNEEGQIASLTLPDVGAALVVGLVGLRTLVIGDQGRLRSWVLLPLGGVVLAGAITTATASDVTAGLLGLIRHSEIFAIIPAATYLALRSREDLRLILLTIVAIGVFEGGVGVYQFLTGTGADLGGHSIRAVGTFGAYNILAMAGLVSYAILVSLAAFVVIRDHRRWWALIAIVGLTLPLIFSFSRGAWISTVAGVLTILAFYKWKWLTLLVVVCGLALGVAYSQAGGSSSVVTERLTSISSIRSSPDQSVVDRYAVWQAARGMWVDHPITGVGPKNFVTFRDSYVPVSFSGGSDIVDPSAGYRRVELLSPHSLYWLILAEQGLVGALAYAALFVSLGLAVLGRLRKADDSPVEKILGFLCLGFLASFLTDSIYADLGGSTTVFVSIQLGCTVWVASGTSVDE